MAQGAHARVDHACASMAQPKNRKEKKELIFTSASFFAACTAHD
jgi:tRNA A37 threonylcarbamoyladenosine synthetase subunit TsaC/SUA5/YrdC